MSLASAERLGINEENIAYRLGISLWKFAISRPHAHSSFADWKMDFFLKWTGKIWWLCPHSATQRRKRRSFTLHASLWSRVLTCKFDAQPPIRLEDIARAVKRDFTKVFVMIRRKEAESFNAVLFVQKQHVRNRCHTCDTENYRAWIGVIHWLWSICLVIPIQFGSTAVDFSHSYAQPMPLMG